MTLGPEPSDAQEVGWKLQFAVSESGSSCSRNSTPPAIHDHRSRSSSCRSSGSGYSWPCSSQAWS